MLSIGRIVQSYITYRIAGAIACVLGLPVLFALSAHDPLWGAYALIGLGAVVVTCGILAAMLWIIDWLRYS